MSSLPWDSPVPQKRWEGFRRLHRGLPAFQTLKQFEEAELSELEESLSEHELKTLGRLLERANKLELEVFIHSHGANPLFDPQADIDTQVGVAKADTVDLSVPPSPRANKAILNGDVVHVLFHAGEATRFQQGPFYTLNPVGFARTVKEKDLSSYLKEIDACKASLPAPVAALLAEGELGPKQILMLRAALRRVIMDEIDAGRLTAKAAAAAYKESLEKQKILFFINPRGALGDKHEDVIRQQYEFFGFEPENIVTIEQELVHGVTVDEEGRARLLTEEAALDAAGHLYALIQAARPGGFTTYTDFGHPIMPSAIDALDYLAQRGGTVLNIIRINDMDRHTTEIINGKALNYALEMFDKGFVNVIEGVSNPTGQKGGTGTTFQDLECHVLTETHENSFPSLSRVFEAAMQNYLKGSAGRHPAYNAMRQLADLKATREALKSFGGRIVFVPRRKNADGVLLCYLGVDMPMGDLSLLTHQYKSRMFQFVSPKGEELLIHDMKTVDHVPLALQTIKRQITDPLIVAAARELCEGKLLPFEKSSGKRSLYGAPTPEFASTNG